MRATRNFGQAIGVAASISMVVSVPYAGAQEAGECPAVEIVATRGTMEDSVGPQQYGDAQSNGFEGDTLSRFFRYMEQRHGIEVFDEVAVTGVSEGAYRAEPELPQEVIHPAENEDRFTAATRLILEQGSISTVIEPFMSFLRSVFDGENTIPKAMNAEHNQQGCDPGIILVGYSQGAMVLQPYEEQLAQEGKLIGSLMLGNPELKLGHADAGQPQHSGGLFALSSAPPQQIAPRYEYCKRNDFVCDTSADVSGGIDMHLSYFDPELPYDSNDEAAADMVAQWVETAKTN
ncbi:cutinase family protein [Corynebacterium freiburgense]|uniref:cutinase family protein n=1 Tax=Corynebacterium freiburgense TaxID=556548 RepID=UPI00047AB6E7|nr:cutinase family protein [Corynebacterium freiburgense]WJZ01536.1 Cutinase [Corynebacterium freiburgense]